MSKRKSPAERDWKSKLETRKFLDTFRELVGPEEIIEASCWLGAIQRQQKVDLPALDQATILAVHPVPGMQTTAMVNYFSLMGHLATDEIDLFSSSTSRTDSAFNSGVNFLLFLGSIVKVSLYRDCPPNRGKFRSTEGAHRACVLLGIIATCHSFGVPVQAYLTWAFERLGTHREIFDLSIGIMTPASFKQTLA